MRLEHVLNLKSILSSLSVCHSASSISTFPFLHHGSHSCTSLPLTVLEKHSLNYPTVALNPLFFSLPPESKNVYIGEKGVGIIQPWLSFPSKNTSLMTNRSSVKGTVFGVDEPGSGCHGAGHCIRVFA